MNFSARLAHAVGQKQSVLMLGLDPDPGKMPARFHRFVEQRIDQGQSFHQAWAQACEDFCREILVAIGHRLCGIKIQMAYFEVFGSAGIAAVENLLEFARSQGLMTLIDGKRGDIGSTCEAYARAYLGSGPCSADALTVNPFLGSDGIEPFLRACEESDRGIFILVKTSNPSSAQFQELIAENIAESVERWGESTISPQGFSSVGAVVGATNRAHLQLFRSLMPHTWILAPGVGAQGGSLEEVLSLRKNGLGVIVPVSRSVLYASSEADFEFAAQAEIERLWLAQK
jgi:orotidine-5'-phosphate decarboxylase